MTTYKNTVKLFIQSVSVSVPFAILILAENVFLFRLLRSFVLADPVQAQPIYFICDLNYLCVLGFLFFIFISYEFMRKGWGAGIDETLCERAWIVEGSQCLVLMTAILVYAFVFFIYVLVGYAVLGMPPECIAELWKVLAVNVVLLSAASVGMGYLISKIRNRFAGYFVILCGLFLTVPQTAKYLLKWQVWYGIPVFFLRDWIYILPPDLDFFADPLYGVPVEGYRIATMCIWIGIGIWLFVRKLWKNKKKNLSISTAVLVGWLVVCGLCAADRGSILLMGEHPHSAVYEQEGYDTGEKIEENVDFRVSAYEMDFRFGHELSAVVKVTLPPGKLRKEYTFTLFRGYEVSKVEDAGGKPLDYEQTGDWVTVKNTGQAVCSSITFRYKGSSPVFYSNRNACFLPGFFAYYPRAGAKNVYADQKYMCVDDYSSHFKISVHGLQTTSNLPAVENGFEGDSSNVILVGGTYEETEEDGVCRVTYPLSGVSRIAASQIKSGEFRQEWEKMLAFYGVTDESAVPLPDDAKKVIVIPTSTLYNSLDHFYEFEDYILVSQSVWVHDLLESRIRAEGKEELKNVLFGMNLNEDTDVNEMDIYADLAEESELSDEEKLHDAVVRQMKKYGVQPTARAVLAYLMNDADTSSPKEFMDRLEMADGQGSH